METEICQVPVSAHITINSDGKLESTYEYSLIPAKILADLLFRGFGLDIIIE